MQIIEITSKTEVIKNTDKETLQISINWLHIFLCLSQINLHVIFEPNDIYVPAS